MHHHSKLSTNTHRYSNNSDLEWNFPTPLGSLLPSPNITYMACRSVIYPPKKSPSGCKITNSTPEFEGSCRFSRAVKNFISYMLANLLSIYSWRSAFLCSSWMYIILFGILFRLLFLFWASVPAYYWEELFKFCCEYWTFSDHIPFFRVSAASSANLWFSETLLTVMRLPCLLAPFWYVLPPAYVW